LWGTVLWLAGWNPLIASYALVFLNLIGLVFLYLAAKKIGGDRMATDSAIIYVFLPVSINYSNFLWNPNFLLILTPIFLWFLASALKNKNPFWFLYSGIMAGVCLQFHFQFTLIIFGTGLIMLLKKEKLKNLIVFMVGMTLGYSPLLVFDLRNNFYNIRTIFEWLKFGSDEKFNFQIYYFLAFIPIFSLFFGLIISKLNKVFIRSGLFLVLIVYSFSIKITQNRALGMPEHWTYSDLDRAAKIIEREGHNFNIVNLLSGDTRFYSLRYLLIKENKEPRPIDSYEFADQLFIVSYDDIEKTKNNPVWEISSFGKSTLKRKWKLNQKVNLYELIKAK
jgi:hypothetical protein